MSVERQLNEVLSNNPAQHAVTELARLFPGAEVTPVDEWKVRISGPTVGPKLADDSEWARDVDFDYAAVEDVQWSPDERAIYVILC
jgi:hypothetical protein